MRESYYLRSIFKSVRVCLCQVIYLFMDVPQVPWPRKAIEAAGSGPWQTSIWIPSYDRGVWCAKCGLVWNVDGLSPTDFLYM